MAEDLSNFMSRPGIPKDIARPPDNEKGRELIRGTKIPKLTLGSVGFTGEQFPDGVHGVPVVAAEGGQTIGSALVTFENGSWSAILQLTSEGATALGVDLQFQTNDHELIEPRPRLLAKVNSDKAMRAITKAAMLRYVTENFGNK